MALVLALSRHDGKRIGEVAFLLLIVAGLGQLHANNAEIAPCDAAPANCRIKYGVTTPGHTPPIPAGS